MCTVTVLPLTSADRFAAAGDFRLACNRDELRTRAPALPPIQARHGQRWALRPRDMPFEGTWIAVNDAGVALTLLNYNPPRAEQIWPPPGLRRSRGLIIPELLQYESVQQVAAATVKLNRDDLPPFRLIAVDVAACAEFTSNGPVLQWRHARRRADEVLFFTSSGLGDDVVEPPRRALFEEFLQRGAWRTPQDQDAFHRHSWPDRTSVSVCMRRDDAHTVSFAVVTVRATEVSLTYHAGPPDETAGVTELSLPRAPGR